MAIDIVARGLATQLVGPDGKISTKKMPTLNGTSGLSGFTSIGKLTDPAMVEGKTSEEILLMMLYGVINPTLTAPSLDIALNDVQLIVGRESVIEGALTFDRGKIEPAYGTSGYRAGLPTSFTIANQESATNDTVYNFSFTLTPIAGDNVINYSVNYSAGEQPLNSIGSAVGEPLAAGSLSGNITLQAVYPLYSETGEDLDFIWFEEDDGEGYMSTFTSEASGKKQSFAVHSEVKVIGIKSYNTLTKSWEWLGGTAAVSLTHFDTSVSEDGYVTYIHNQPASGKRELRIYVGGMNNGKI